VAKRAGQEPAVLDPGADFLRRAQGEDGLRAGALHRALERQVDKFDNLWHEFLRQGAASDRPDDGAFLVSCASHDDPDLAPPGKQVLSAIYIAPYNLKYHDWDDIADEWAWDCIDSLEKRAFPGCAPTSSGWTRSPPTELERRLRLPEGAFFGLEMSGLEHGAVQAQLPLAHRGLAVPYWPVHHPGGGVPLVMLSGIAASSMLVNDWPSL